MDMEVEEARHEFFDDICGICNLEIGEDEPKMELMCFHTLHTRCIYRAIADNNVQAFMCTRCENDRAGVFAEVGQEEHPEQVPEVQRVPMRDQIEETFANNPIFRQDLKKVVKAYGDYSKQRTLLARAIREKRMSVRAEVQLIRNNLQQIQRGFTQDIGASEVYKEARRAFGRLNAYRWSLIRKYAYSFSEIKRIIGRKRGFRRLRSMHYYYNTPARMIRRGLYFRIRI